MAPRGIIAAAVVSVFSLRLQEQNFPQAKLLVPYVFLVIVCTVTLYGLTGAWIARRLGLARTGNGGFLIAGADRFAREIAHALIDEGIELLLVDTSLANVRDARLAGLPALSANALSSQVAERIELSGISRLLAMTSNDEVNSLAAVHYGKQFGQYPPLSNCPSADTINQSCPGKRPIRNSPAASCSAPKSLMTTFRPACTMAPESTRPNSPANSISPNTAPATAPTQSHVSS